MASLPSMASSTSMASSSIMASYSSPSSLTADLETPENQRARIALFANREYIARSINAIRKRYRTPGSLPPPPISPVSVDGGYISHIAHLFERDSPFLQEHDVDPRSLPNLQDGKNSPTWPPPNMQPSKFHVGIVGAGMAGLYTAMILKSLNITYQIIEASDRIGGRVYTHRFSNAPGDYYDAGAMRFPDNPIMARTFHLFAQLGIELNGGPPNTQLQQQLIRYHLKGDATPSYYNNIRVVLPAIPPNPDPFNASIANGGTVPNEFVAFGAGAGGVLAAALDVWRQQWLVNPVGTWAALNNGQDANAVSTRQVILTNIHLNNPGLTQAECLQVANWSELTGSTCSYDQSLIETFIHSMDFDYPMNAPALDPDAPEAGAWWCLNGGTDILARRMVARLHPVPEILPVNAPPWEQNIPANIITGRRVIKISHRPELNANRSMQVDCEGAPMLGPYSHVITTTTIPCLQVMDLREAGLNYAQRESIRVLRCNPAVKLGIKFKWKWWIADGINRGGQGKTDRPTRTVVYPSYGLNDPDDAEGVLLACYNSSMDAARLGGHATGGDPTNQQRILDIVLHDLAEMHGMDYDDLCSLVICHHFHDWSHDGITCGGWGEFGPGQFTAFFGPLQQPAAVGHLFFAGELTSVYHGWIVASLKSAYRSVYQMLWMAGQGGLLDELVNLWGLDAEAAADPNMTDWLIALGVLGAPLGI